MSGQPEQATINEQPAWIAALCAVAMLCATIPTWSGTLLQGACISLWRWAFPMSATGQSVGEIPSHVGVAAVYAVHCAIVAGLIVAPRRAKPAFLALCVAYFAAFAFGVGYLAYGRDVYVVAAGTLLVLGGLVWPIAGGDLLLWWERRRS